MRSSDNNHPQAVANPTVKGAHNLKKTIFLKVGLLLCGLLWVGLASCTSVSHPEVNSPILYSAVATPTSTPISTTETSPSLTPTTPPPTTTSPSPLPPATFTPTPSNPTSTPTLTPTPVVTGPRLIEPEDGWLNFTVHLPAEPDPNAKPVSHLLYTTADIPRAYTTTLWLAEVKDITQRQVITTFHNFFGYPATYFILSPDEAWLLYVEGGEDAFEAQFNLMDLNTLKSERLDFIAYTRPRGGKTILWRLNSEALVYITPWTEVYLYEFETKQSYLLTQITTLTDPLPDVNYDVILIGWLTDDILLYTTTSDQVNWEVNSIEISSRHITSLANLEMRDVHNVVLSPHRRNIMFSSVSGCPLLSIDPQTQVTDVLATKFGCGFRPVWHPDNQVSLGARMDGMIATDLRAMIPLSSKQVTPTIVKIPSPDLVAPLSWSDQGRYLMYKDRTIREGILVDVQTGDTQIIGDPFFEFVGWLHRE